MSKTIANRLIISNSLWIIAEKSLRFVLGILVIGLVARHLGAELFGELNFALAVLAVAVVVASVGMNRIVTREVVESGDDADARSVVISTAFFMRLVVALVIVALLSVYSYFFSSQDATLFLLVVFSLLFNPFDVVDLHQQGVARLKSISVMRSGVFVVASVLKLALVYLDVGAVWFFFFVLVEHALIALCFYTFVVTNYGRGYLSFRRCKWSKATSILKESWPEVFAGLGGILFMRLDQIMLQFMQGAESVGVYSAAVRISEAWYFFPIAVISASFPKIVQLRTGPAKRYEDAMVVLFSALVVIAGLAVLFFLMLSNQIVAVVFGAQYSESALVLQVHCLTAVFILMGSASGSWLAAERKLVWNLHRNLFGLVVNVVLNLTLIPRYGAVGAALATLISAFSAYYLFDLLSPKLRFMFRIKTLALFTFGIYGALRAKHYSALFKS